MIDLVVLIRGRIHDSHMETERLLDNAADEIERLRAVLVKIRETAVTSRDDDRTWMDERTTLEGFIDSELNSHQ